MIEILAPDGTTVRFPEGTPDDVILRVMRENFGGPDAAPSATAGEVAAPMQPPPVGDAMALMRDAGLAGAPSTGPGNFKDMQRTASAEIGADTQARIAPFFDPMLNNLHGFTYGYSEDALAALAAQMGRVPQTEIANDFRDQRDAYYERAPVQAAVTEITGLLANPISKLGPGQGTLPVQMAQGLATGGLLGFLYGTGTEEGGPVQRMVGAIDDALIGGGVGLALPAVGAAVGRGVDALRNSWATRQAARNTPSLENLRQAADYFYDQADNVVMPRQGLAATAQTIDDRATRLGMHPRLTPNSVDVVDEVTNAATAPDPNISFRELDILRAQASIPAGNMQNNREAAIGSLIKDALDDFIENTDPQTSKILGEARDLWGRLRRSEIVERAIENAGRQASGFENGIRVQFRAILNNPRLSRSFTQAERDAMEQVIRGTPLGNAMRWIGKFGLGLTQNTNAVGATLGAGVGAALGGPFGAVALPAIATGARKAAEMTTSAAANRLLPLIAAGTVPSVPSSIPALGQAFGLLGQAPARVLSPELGLLAPAQTLAQ